MSDTPKAEYRLLELLEATIYDLKTENNKLRKDLDGSVYLNQAVSMLAGLPTAREMEDLMKDKERLDWLIDHAYIQFYKVDDGGEWEMELDASDARNHIDKEMEDYKA
jgi:hypothetical protein